MLGPPVFAPAAVWAFNFAAPPRIPMAGDVDGDGLADLICVYPPGDSIIDVSLNVGGMKAGYGFQARTKWGKDCQGAIAGDVDGDGKTDVIGLFDGQTLRLAGEFKDRQFQDTPVWVKLPKKLERPGLGWRKKDSELVAFSQKTGEAFSVSLPGKEVNPALVPRGTLWLGSMGGPLRKDDPLYLGSWGTGSAVIQRASGEVALGRGTTWKRLGKMNPASRPCSSGGSVAMDGSIAAFQPSDTAVSLPLSSALPPAPCVRHFADMDGDGDQDILEFRYGSEHHTAFDILVYRQISPGETDSDHDGLTNDQERALGTDPMSPDTDGDGLLDGWETGTFRDLDLRGMGCSPLHTDLICLLSRFDGLDEALAKSEIQRCVDFYAGLKVSNPDGKTGWNLHPIWLNVLDKEEQKNPWWVLRDKHLPAKWRGMVHWMQLTPWGGGQADQLGDGGGCGGGKNSLFATFVHEFGHQIGMDHAGFWSASHCPIYRSLMNYAYSYSLDGDVNKINYSYGEFKGYVLDEKDLDEEIPLTYDSVKFLEKGPYGYRLKPNGKTTLIDWNWNGVFGEKHIQADINYSYSTSAGTRDTVDKAMAAPWWIVQGKDAFLLYAKHDKPVDKDKSPDVSVEKPGTLYLRKLLSETKWHEPWVIEKEAVIGDPVGLDLGDSMLYLYQTKDGVAFRTGKVVGDKLEVGERTILNTNSKLVPTVGKYRGTAYVFLWNPEDGAINYLTLPKDPTPENLKTRTPVALSITSTVAPGMCEDTKTHEMVLGLAQDQDENRKTRWQIRRFKTSTFDLRPSTLSESAKPEWVEGEAGRAAGNGRCTLLFDDCKNAGKDGRLLFFSVGIRGAASPWACGYVAMQIADRSIRGGWLVKRYYDEWTQSRSSIATTWFQGEILYAYRWVDGGQGTTDNNLQVGYRGSGIDPQPMGDHDDVTFLKTFGIKHCIMWMNRE